jgi:hypothetical protein
MSFDGLKEFIMNKVYLKILISCVTASRCERFHSNNWIFVNPLYFQI